MERTMRDTPSRFLAFFAAGAVGIGLALTANPASAKDLSKDNYRPADVRIVMVKPLGVSEDGTINLTGSGCQFVEPEGKAQDIAVTFPRDCPRENRKTENVRLPNIKTLILKPGTYKFRVENANVPFALGLEIYALNDKGKKAKKPLFSQGELLTGYHEVYEVVLEEGQYVYTGRQNPTFEYPLLVTNSGVTNSDKIVPMQTAAEGNKSAARHN